MKPPNGFWREDEDHKGSGGRLLIIGGSKGMVGAGALAAAGAVRAGCGSVLWMVAESVAPMAVPLFLDGWVRPLPDAGSGHLLAGHLQDLLALQATTAVVGPGFGQGAQQWGLLTGLIDTFSGALVLDADALNMLAVDQALLRKAAGPVVITPHAAEAGRLLGIETAAVEADREGAAKQLVERTGAVVVLKGAHSIVASTRQFQQLDRPAPVLATAGSGDVLAGMIGALLARKVAVDEAVTFCVNWHLEAGLELQSALGGSQGLGATAILDALGVVQQNGFT